MAPYPPQHHTAHQVVYRETIREHYLQGTQVVNQPTQQPIQPATQPATQQNRQPTEGEIDDARIEELARSYARPHRPSPQQALPVQAETQQHPQLQTPRAVNPQTAPMALQPPQSQNQRWRNMTEEEEDAMLSVYDRPHPLGRTPQTAEPVAMSTPAPIIPNSATTSSQALAVAGR
jgi:hypothetical protein